MKFWLDTEFDGFGGELISIALVGEDGSEWYEVVRDHAESTWVRANVLPLLGKPAANPSVVRAGLQTFLANHDSVHVIADWPEDVAHFCRLLTSGAMRLRTPPLTFEICERNYESPHPHHALSDARALRRSMLT